MHKRTAFRRLWSIALTLGLIVPAQSAFADIDPSLIPDGTYPAHVDKVIDAKHIKVTMQGTIKTELESSAPFTDVKVNDDLQVTLSVGKVTAFTKK